MEIYRKCMFSALAVGCFLCATPVTAEDGRKLGKVEVEELFTGVTFDGAYLPNNKKSIAYDAPDGRLEILRPTGKRDRGRTWFVNEEGQRCATSPRWREPRCFDVYDAGNDVYHQYLDGNHVHTLSKLQKGNQL